MDLTGESTSGLQILNRGEILAQPSPRGVWYFNTELIQIWSISVVDLDKKHPSSPNSLVFQSKSNCTGNCEKYMFHSESSQKVRDDLNSRACLISLCLCLIHVVVRATPCRQMHCVWGGTMPLVCWPPWRRGDTGVLAYSAPECLWSANVYSREQHNCPRRGHLRQQ